MISFSKCKQYAVAFPELSFNFTQDMQMRKKIYFLAFHKVFLGLYFFAFLIVPTNSYSQFRKYSNEFLNIGAGARGLGMGGAQVATVADGSAGYWNPAGLTYVKDYPQINLMHASYFAGIGKYDYASIAIPTTNERRVIGITALRFAVDDIMNTLFLIEPDGTINYNNIQSFSSADYAFLFSIGQVVKEEENKSLRLGFNAKLIHRSVGHFAKAWGFGFDAGLQYQKNNWNVGLTARDFTSTFNAWSFHFTDREKEMLYLTNNAIPVHSTELTAPRLLLGIGHRFNFKEDLSLLAEADFDMSFDGKRNVLFSSNPISVDPKLGVELNVHDHFFLRGGVNNFQQGLYDGDTLNKKKVWIFQPGAGVGFKIQQLTIDYAFINLANQSNPLYTHVFSLKFDLSENKNKMR